ncbi:B3/4 domain-containing protein [Peribacillus alkalitolerans]|uniref:B3/B4 domain-containing protein n=1 Tax=Peribacillus alkalitolerans TaxID=1550385 RepID=UPI0013D0B08F|nr:phenylalanine--tRNA ligase beta subunit-related protein [Peribacillus alkalitolerans]
MEIYIDQTLKEKVPGFKIGYIQYNGIEVGDSPQMLKGRLQLFQESLYFDMLEKEIMSFEGLKEWRDTFKLAGSDPSRYRHAAEALYRRIKKQNYLPSVHSAIDVNNFFSLQYQVPIGIYDLAHIKGNITFAIGQANDEYEGINGRTNSMFNMIHSRDELGPFGSPYVDSERTKVTTDTKNAVQFIYLRPSISIEEAEKMTQSLKDMFLQIHGGEAKNFIIG